MALLVADDGAWNSNSCLESREIQNLQRIVETIHESSRFFSLVAKAYPSSNAAETIRESSLRSKRCHLQQAN